ncbi:MAG: hypothetical protein JKX71_12780 [Amylibacter sp.]|nr:hypothetical protein [Amylibacter sp.]
MIEFDLTTLYSLFHAFDQTGRRMFGDSWRGIEAFAQRKDDPKATKDERAKIIARIRDLSAQSIPYQTILDLGGSQEETQMASDALYPLHTEERALKEKLTAIPHVTDHWVNDHEAYFRRRRVEDELRTAFDNHDLDLHLGNSSIVEMRSWSKCDGFRIYYGLSMVRVPSQYAGKQRRQPAFIPKAALDKWLTRFGSISSNEAELTPEMRLKIWLEGMVDKYKPKERKKSDYCTQALNEITGLSKREFDRVWAATVPISWKASGAPEKK